jgi:hypothetical protein
MTYIDR